VNWPNFLEIPANWTQSVGELSRGLESESPSGLSSAEAKIRLEKAGPNALRTLPKKPYHQFLAAQFKSTLVLLLLAAGGISLFMGETVDALVIYAIVVLNALIGSIQEFNADKAIDALKSMTSPRAKVKRNGQLMVVAAEEIVPGDWITLEAGDLVPADARLVEAAALKTVESALTGESEGVFKDATVPLTADTVLSERKSMVYQGTSVATGEALALVVATGARTELGRIATLLDSVGNVATPLQQQIEALGRKMTWLCLGLVLLMAAIGLWRGMTWVELLLTSISLAVAAVPEGLPAVVTIAMSLGVKRMAKRNALIRSLPSVETLGSATVICTDKTGTLTQGRMTTQVLSLGSQEWTLGTPITDQQKAAFQTLGQLHAWCNQASLEGKEPTGDPTEIALLVSAREMGIHAKEAPQKLLSFPFDSDRKRQSAWFQWGDRYRLMVHGSPESVLDLCLEKSRESGGVSAPSEQGDAATSGLSIAQLRLENEKLAARGLRVLASAYRDFPHDQPLPKSWEESESQLQFGGFAGLQDPLRLEAREAVAECQAAGLRVVMITGDQVLTAEAIARELGLLQGKAEVLAGKELETLTDAELDNRVEKIAVYARVSPQHKFRVIQAWKRKGAIAAMTGDGVNDAPALKEASIGIAMGITGTEVAKQASDIVLADDRFATLVAAIREGRIVYGNIRNTLQYLLAGNTGELLLLVSALSLDLPIPLLPVHLLWINLLTDGLPALALAADRGDGSEMLRPPRQSGSTLTSGSFLFQMAFTGFLTGGVALFAYYHALNHMGVEAARSFAFATLVCSEVLRAFGARSESQPLWKMPWKGRWLLPATLLTLLVVQVLAHQLGFAESVLKTTAFSFQQWVYVIGLGSLPLVTLEAWKALGPRFGSRPTKQLASNA
jgi:P-type Ca2+ transporter type 2C